MTPLHMQYYVNELEELRGFAEETIEDKIECLEEEVKEFVEALRGNGDPAEEGIDVINPVLMIFNRLGIDFDEAFMKKYEKDKTRV